jgi:hypothetical protein
VKFVFALLSISAAFAAPAPCSLLTPEEVSAALGAKAEAPQPVSTKSCSWAAPNSEKKSGRFIVTVTLLTDRDFAGAKTPQAGVTKTPVNGVGDEAVFGALANFGTLWVKKGSSYFVVKVYGVPLDQAQAKEKALALKVLGRL